MLIRIFCTYLLCSTLTTFEVYFWISLQNLPNPSVKLWSFQWSIRADKWQTITKLLINFQSKKGWKELVPRSRAICYHYLSGLLDLSGVYGKFKQQKTAQNFQILKKITKHDNFQLYYIWLFPESAF